MTQTIFAAVGPAAVLAQMHHVRGAAAAERDSLIISMRKVDDTWVIVSHYGEDIWWLTGRTTNTVKSECKLDFTAIPHEFRDTAKAVIYRLMRRGRVGHKRPGPASLHRFFRLIQLFFLYLNNLKISSLTNVTPLVCIYYARTRKSRTGAPLATATLFTRLSAVEALHELSQHTDTPMNEHPWLDSSASQLSKHRKDRDTGKKTPLMPDDVFTTLFQNAWDVIRRAEEVLDLRDEMARIIARAVDVSRTTSKARRNKRLRELGFKGGLAKLKSALLEIRTAAYIVVASVSGCRNHELAFLGKNTYYSTEDDDGELYWWMRSKSTKTGEGAAEWMVPEAAITALKVMERWSAPYQETLRREIDCLRVADPLDPQISEAEEHLDALFVGNDLAKGLIRTLGSSQWNERLRAFAIRCGLTWDLASHHFRRKFANYAARSQFGDLRFLKEHFKHWSMNMTLGYALNESQEMALYLDIEAELGMFKEEVVSGWLDATEPLAGGYGKNIRDWRSREENIVLFKNHAHMVKSIASSTAIRSNGHAWCTADDGLCVGNTIEPTRCGGGCNNSVIGPVHAVIYQGLYDHLLMLREADDIGKGGRARVQRDLDRCADVLCSLGYTPTKVPG